MYNNYFKHYPLPSLARQMNQLAINSNMKDSGPEPFVIDIENATKENTLYRTTLWTGDYLQLTLMSIDVGEDIGREVHADHDQFIRIESGQGVMEMGNKEDEVDFQRRVKDDFIAMIPAGKWHNLINTGIVPLKLYSLYAPPEHSHGTVHKTKPIVDEVEYD